MALNRSLRILTGMLILAAGLIMQTESFVTMVLSCYENIFDHRLDYAFRYAGFSYAGQVLMFTGFLWICSLLFFDKKNHVPDRPFIFLCYAFLLAFFFYRVITDAVNVPVWDDYGTTLEFADNWFMQTTLADKCRLIAAPFYESRMITLRTLNSILLLLTGEINFKTIILINDIFFMLIAFILLKYSTLENRLVYFLPIFIFNFQFQSYDCLLWATSGFNFIFTMLASMAAFIFILRKGKHDFIIAILFALLATLTYGNGWIAWIIIIFYLLRLKKTGKVAVVIVICGITALLYFKDPLQSPSGIIHETHWFDYAVYYFSFCGSAFRFFNSRAICTVVGILLHVLFLWLCKRKYYRINPLFFQVAVFILLSAITTTIFRTADGGTGQALSPRYGFYSQLLFICLLTGYAETMQLSTSLRRFKGLVLASVVWQLMTGFMFYPEAVIRKNILTEYIRPWKENPSDRKINSTVNPWIFGGEPETVISRAVTRGIYHP